MSDLRALQWVTMAGLACTLVAVTIGLVYVRRAIAVQRESAARLAAVYRTYLRLLSQALAREQTSLKCRLYGLQPHEPCSGTRDDGTGLPCECWCHRLSTVV